MIAVLLIVLFAWIASGCGQVILAGWLILHDRPLERFTISAALGLGIAAYGVFVLGMCGLLSFWPVAIWWLVLAIVGWRGMGIQVADLRHWFSARTASASDSQQPKAAALLTRVCLCVLVIFGMISIIAALRPPGAVEWDVLAYHLADPKVFLQQHRISVLPTDHHSNFPFTVEMLFAVGLLFNGYALANLSHLLLAALTTVGILAFGERCFGRGAGSLAAVLFVTTPLVLWEASVAYIDVGAALYTFLAAMAAISAIDAQRNRTRKPSDVPASAESASDVMGHDAVRSWVVLAGVTMGFALGIKYLALIPLALIALLMLYRRLGLSLVLRYALIALVVGSPWYIKNAVVMRNPVYPFYYRVFPNTRYWSLGREQAYRSEQSGFGYPHSLAQPRETLLNLLEAPWRLLTDGVRYFNAGEYTFSALIGGLYGAFCFATLLLRRRSAKTGDVAVLAVLQFVAWFFVAQIGRYLIQILPLFALLGGVSAARLLWKLEDGPNILNRILSAVVVALFAGNVLLVLWSVTMLPVGGKAAFDLVEQTGLRPTALSLPEAFSAALHPENGDHVLSSRLDVYDAEQWINHSTPPDARVVLYEETRGFYLDRPYLWGNDQHSSYIPYDTFRNGADVTNWMNSHGYRYAIVNLNWSAKNQEHRKVPDYEAEQLLREWYVDTTSKSKPGDWYRSVGDAIRKGLWNVVKISKGNVVLQIGGRDRAVGLSPVRDNGGKG